MFFTRTNTWGFFPLDNPQDEHFIKLLNPLDKRLYEKARDVACYLKYYNYLMIGLADSRLVGIQTLPIISGCGRIICGFLIFYSAYQAKYKYDNKALSLELLYTGLCQIVRGLLDAFIPYGVYVNLALDIMMTYFNFQSEPDGGETPGSNTSVSPAGGNQVVTNNNYYIIHINQANQLQLNPLPEQPLPWYPALVAWAIGIIITCKELCKACYELFQIDTTASREQLHDDVINFHALHQQAPELTSLAASSPQRSWT